MTREEALAEKYVNRSELINKIYNNFDAQLKSKDEEIKILMEKALEILRNDNVFDEEYLSWNKIDIVSAIKELEEDMKPKSCDSCRSKSCSVKRILLERGEINSSYFYCNDYEPKDTQ